MTNQANGHPTARRLVTAGQELFSRHGFDGTPVRRIASRAKANLGAIAYHFGSKEALYDAVMAAVAGPFRERVAQTAAQPGAPLDRVERVVRVFFDHLNEFPAFPKLVAQHLAGSRELPAPGREAMRGNLGTLAALIQQGQRDGSIRDGDPRIMAMSIGAQPMFLSLIRRTLRDATGIDLTDPETRLVLVEQVVRSVRASLANPPAR